VNPCSQDFTLRQKSVTPECRRPATLRRTAEVSDDAFAAYVGDRLGGLPGVQAVTLGGSRAQGTHRPDSDWDFSVYYRGTFEPGHIRALGWPGEVFPVGGWGGGVFNGGAWLTVDGRRADVHYRARPLTRDPSDPVAGARPAS
jgi:hypothetical protein